MTWDCSIADELAEMFDEYTQRTDALEESLETVAAMRRDAQAERYRTWYLHNKKRHRELHADWRRRNPKRPAELERRHYLKWKSRRTTEEMRAIWRARKAKRKPPTVWAHHCRSCGLEGHNVRSCQTRFAA